MGVKLESEMEWFFSLGCNIQPEINDFPNTAIARIGSILL